MKGAVHLKWLRANGHSTAGLTGTDARALAALAACWELYSLERDERALEAVASLVLVMQPSMQPLARALIPWAMDWSDEGPVWQLVEARIVRKRLEAGVRYLERGGPTGPDCTPPLTAAQRDGLHCVRCGRGSGHMVPIGVLDGVQLFAHPTIRGHAPGCEGA